MFRDKIREIMDKQKAEIMKLLEEKYPNLVFYINNDNSLNVWVRDKRDGSREGLPIKTSLSFFNEFIFDKWNDLAEKSMNNPTEYFICSECGQLMAFENFEANIFAGYYCKDCAKKPEIAELIAESKKAGFYD